MRSSSNRGTGFKVILIFSSSHISLSRNPNFGSSSALANANAYNQNFGPNGFGASAANAGAQAFQSQGPLGGFGAAASNAQSQGFQVGPNGFQVRIQRRREVICLLYLFFARFSGIRRFIWRTDLQSSRRPDPVFDLRQRSVDRTRWKAHGEQGQLHCVLVKVLHLPPIYCPVNDLDLSDGAVFSCLSRAIK